MTNYDWHPVSPADGDQASVQVSRSEAGQLTVGRLLAQPQDRALTWLRSAMIALGLLAGAAAVVSWQAQ